MAKRIGLTEAIAREICWREFVPPRPTHTTKAAYWRNLPGSTRAAYMREAELVIWAHRNIPVDLLNEIYDEAPHD